jgi:hypothetical protein
MVSIPLRERRSRSETCRREVGRLNAVTRRPFTRTTRLAVEASRTFARRTALRRATWDPARGATQPLRSMTKRCCGRGAVPLAEPLALVSLVDVLLLVEVLLLVDELVVELLVVVVIGAAITMIGASTMVVVVVVVIVVM